MDRTSINSILQKRRESERLCYYPWVPVGAVEEKNLLQEDIYVSCSGKALYKELLQTLFHSVYKALQH